jgi:hypothetical protein
MPPGRAIDLPGESLQGCRRSSTESFLGSCHAAEAHPSILARFPEPSTEAPPPIVVYSGQYARARDQAQALLARADAPIIRNYLGLAQFHTGDVSAARRTLAAVMRNKLPDVRSQAALASIEAAAGDREPARARAQRIEQGPVDHHVAVSLAATWAQLGDALAAVRWLRQAADSGYPCLPAIERDPLLSPLRGHPEYAALLALLRERFNRNVARFGAAAS